MAATDLIYPTSALGFSVPTDAGSHWHYPINAAGAPNGQFASNDDPTLGGVQELVLTGYNPQAAILAGTGGRRPYSIDYLHVGVTFQLDSATNYDSIDVLLLNAARAPIARQRLYLWDATTGVTVVGWVNFTAHNGYDSEQPLTWDDLADCAIALEVTRSKAAWVDNFQVDAVGMFAAYTLDAPTTPTAPPAPIQVQPPGGGVTLRVYDRGGNRLAILPWMTLTRAVVRNDVGTLATSVPKALIPAGVLDGERYLRVAVNGVEVPEWYVLDDDGDDDADEGGTMRPVSIGGSGTGEILDWGVVYSWQYQLDPSGVTDVLRLDPWQEFAGKTPGYIMAALIDQAKARGCFPHLSYSFTADVDSAGVGWPTLYSHKYDIGTSVLKVLTTMSDDGWVDWKMTGFTLDLYAADTALATDHPEVVLRLGKGVTQAPRKRTRKTTRTVLLSNGDQGAAAEVVDANAETTWGRREGYEGRSGVTDLGTLTAATTVSLSRQTSASESFTLELDPYALPTETPALPRPGGYIRYDRRRLSPTDLEPLRVQSVAYDYSDPPKVSVELQDLWLDADVKRARQIDTILNGSTANQRVPVPQEAPDTLAPAAVAGLGLESTAYLDQTGQLFAQMTATWTEVTRNVDNSPISDLAGYEIQWRQLDVGLSAQTISINALTKWQWSPVAASTATDVRIRAVDRFGNPSDWSPWVTIISGNDVTPPPKPSTPTVDNYLGLLRTAWDGGFAGGAPRPSDLRRVEVHIGTLAGFTIDTRPLDAGGTWAGNLIAAGAVFTDVPYGQTRYVKLVAVDVTGNRSDISDEVSGTSSQVVSPDIFDGAVGSAKLADLAVITAKINDLAVNNAKIGSLDVGKLTAGSLTAQVTISGSISTNANPDTTGGVQINPLGIYAWAPPVGGAQPQQTVAIDTLGNATLVGTYRTAFSGRRIELGTATSVGRLQFYSPTGILSELFSFTEGTGLEALQMRISNSSINMNTQDWTSYNAYKHQFAFRDSINITGLNKSIGQIIVNDSGNTNASPRLQLLNAGGFGVVLKHYYQTGMSSHLEVKDVNDSGFAEVWGAQFINSSDRAAKTGIRVIPHEEKQQMLDEVLALDVHRYRRKGRVHMTRLRDDGGVEHVEADGPEEIGLIAQTAPAQIRADSGESLGIDQYQMTTMVLAALQASHTDLSKRLTALEKNGARP